MAELKILLPQFGMGMQEAEVLRWLKAVGERVEEGETIVEVEAAKATVEVPSPGAGVLTEIIAAEGDIIEVRAHIATLSV